MELVDDAAQMKPDAFIGFYRALHRWNVERELRRIAVPALVVAGGKDALVPLAATQRTASLLPRGELVEWPHVGHAPMFDAPDELTDLLVRFSRRQSRAMRVWTFSWLVYALVARFFALLLLRLRRGR